MRYGALTLFLVALVFGSFGCGGNDSAGDPPTASDVSTGQLAPPGLYELGEDRRQALGTLVHRDLEGGFWAVVAAYPGEPADDAEVVAVLANAEDLDVDLNDLAGSFVKAEGTLLDASIRMAGPELEVDSIAVVQEMTAPSNDATTE